MQLDRAEELDAMRDIKQKIYKNVTRMALT
jgi:hypothetical protein